MQGLSDHPQVFHPVRIGPDVVGGSVTTSLFALHSLSETSSKDRLTRMINYQIPSKDSNTALSKSANTKATSASPDSSVSSKGATAPLSGIVDDHISGVMNVREPMKFFIETMPAAYVAGASSYSSTAAEVAPTPGSMLSYRVAMDLIRPMDSVQVVCVKNTGITKYQREIRLYALLQYLRSGKATSSDKYLSNLKTREDVEVFEKHAVQERFLELIGRHAYEAGGMPSPTFSSVVLPPQRQKKCFLRFPSAMYVNGNEAKQKPPARSTCGDSVASDESDGVTSLSYESHEVVLYAAAKTPKNDAFVVVGYDYGDCPPSADGPRQDRPSRSNSASFVNNSSLVSACEGWIHRHGVLR